MANSAKTTPALGAHLPSLTGARFLAALLVVLYHAGAWVEEVPTAPAGPFRFGYVGVSFFFVLSGFVLTWTWRPGERTRSFYLRRFARVWPLHALTTCVAGCLALSGLAITARLEALPAHLLVVQSWWLDSSWIFQWNSPSWSLACEAFFYAVFPVLVAFHGRPRVLLGIALGWLICWGVLVLEVRPDLTHFLYTFPAYRAGEFAVGVAAGMYLRAGRRLPVGLAAGATVAVGGYALIWLGDRLAGGFFGREQWASQLVVLGGFALVILTAAQHDLDGRPSPLGAPWMVKLGQWSFALYLVHQLVFVFGVPVRSNLGMGARYVVILALSVVAVGVSAAAYEWFERPIEKRIRSWGSQRESVLAAARERSVD